jgi:hypothetical protein
MTSLTFSFRKSTVTTVVVWVAALASGSLAAAPLPKEGPVNVTSCFVGDITLMEASKENKFGSVTLNGLRFTPTEGGLGDATTTECFVQSSVDATGVIGSGVCVSVDTDGDKVSSEITGKNGVGKWIFTGGTGKYAGITGNGEYKPIRKFPAMMQQGKMGTCNSSTGTYKLP